jgi:hypothetical protein
MKENPMANKRKPKAVASTVNNAKKQAEAREKASARVKKVQGKVDMRSSQLDAALMALEKTDVGSPKAREVEEAARAALKKLLVRRKKLRKARKALRRAEAKERKAHDRAAAVGAKKAPAQAPAAQSRKASKTRPARKRQAGARAKSSATKLSALDTMPAIEAISGVDAGGVERAPDEAMK